MAGDERIHSAARLHLTPLALPSLPPPGPVAAASALCDHVQGKIGPGMRTGPLCRRSQVLLLLLLLHHHNAYTDNRGAFCLPSFSILSLPADSPSSPPSSTRPRSCIPFSMRSTRKWRRGEGCNACKAVEGTSSRQVRLCPVQNRSPRCWAQPVHEAHLCFVAQQKTPVEGLGNVQMRECICAKRAYSRALPRTQTVKGGIEAQRLRATFC